MSSLWWQLHVECVMMSSLHAFTDSAYKWMLVHSWPEFNVTRRPSAHNNKTFIEKKNETKIPFAMVTAYDYLFKKLTLVIVHTYNAIRGGIPTTFARQRRPNQLKQSFICSRIRVARDQYSVNFRSPGGLENQNDRFHRYCDFETVDTPQFSRHLEHRLFNDSC